MHFPRDVSVKLRTASRYENVLRNIGKDFATRNCDFVHTDAQRNMKQLRFFSLLRDIMTQTTFTYFTYIFVQ